MVNCACKREDGAFPHTPGCGGDFLRAYSQVLSLVKSRFDSCGMHSKNAYSYGLGKRSSEQKRYAKACENVFMQNQGAPAKTASLGDTPPLQ